MKIYPCPRCGQRMVKNGKTPTGTQRWVCKSYQPGTTARLECYKTTRPWDKAPRDQGGRAVGPEREPDKEIRHAPALEGIERLIITSAQNATPVHEGFLGALRTAAKYLDAKIIVIPLRYKNPTSRWSASQANAETWHEAVWPYLCNVRKRLGPNLMLLADVKTQPTATRPLTGFEAITGSESAILGHTKMQLTVIPAPASKFPKIMTTTGAVTVPNYTDTSAGKKGEFHHVLGAVIVERQGKAFHLRQLLADKDGTFTDLDVTYRSNGYGKAEPAEALVMGDTHVDVTDKLVDQATFGKGGLVDTLQPKALVWHDLSDEGTVNPHTLDNPFVKVAKHAARLSNVREEIERAARFVKERTPKGRTSVIVPSNHTDFLQRWMVRHDWRDDPENAEFYLESALEMVRRREGERGDIFSYWLRKYLNGSDVKILQRDESFARLGVEFGLHGDKGPNGARGSRMNLRRIGVKTVIGHAHSPGIEEGCYQVGTSTGLRLDYNSGPSSWLQTHCVLYASGKRSLITIINGKWRL
jgi:hypothetical protein